MKKLLGIVVLGLSLAICNTVQAKDGSGKLKISETTLNHFLSYLGGDGQRDKGLWFESGEPMVFAITQSGKYSAYYYCPKEYVVKSGGCTPVGTVIGPAQNACKKYVKESGSSERCFIFAKKRKIVWDSMNYKFPKKLSTDIVKKKLIELGFYGQQAEKKIEKKETKTTKKKTKVTKDDDIVQKIKELKELYDSGALTEEEFSKAKKKLLN